jgi:hypothetical protein
MSNTKYVPEKQNLLILGKEASLNMALKWKLALPSRYFLSYWDIS